MEKYNESSPAIAAPKVKFRGVKFGRICALAASAAIGLIIGYTDPVAARGIGTTNLLANDAWGDGNDRWQTGSFQQSVFASRKKESTLDYLEWRGRAKLVTPWGRQPNKNDRPFSGMYAFGLFGHKMLNDWQITAGAEMLVQGQQTRLHKVQQRFHKLASFEGGYDFSKRNDPVVEDRISGRIMLEAGYALRPTPNLLLRPYVATKLGGDQAVYAGADLIIGSVARANLWNRDVVTGQLLTPGRSKGRAAFNLIAGADMVRVKDSIHLPSELGVEREPKQTRMRMGVRADLGTLRLFLGQAWLSEQFIGQSESQRVGTVSVSMGF